jgi:nucleoside phosphorylase
LISVLEDSRPANQGYRVGWICTLLKELDASQKMLDEHYENRLGKGSDNNLYVLGRIGQLNVVMTCLPMGRYGNNTAVVVATRMMGEFLNTKIGLMVGIGGGLPNDHDDI